MPTPAEKTAEAVSRFTKDSILRSARYQRQRDMLAAVLDGKKTYTHDEIKKIIGDFMKGKVK